VIVKTFERAVPARQRMRKLSSTGHSFIPGRSAVEARKKGYGQVWCMSELIRRRPVRVDEYSFDALVT
jgi:hypothetical protein